MNVEGVRAFLQSKAGRGVAAGVLLIGIAAAVFSIANSLGDNEAAALSRERIFVCAETGKGFEYTLREGDTVPVRSPHSGKNTGYPAELCFWTADGKTKDEPTAVRLVGMDRTFCPECERLVVPYNPRPKAGDQAPPTRAELNDSATAGVR